jgi:hypothetical protein
MTLRKLLPSSIIAAAMLSPVTASSEQQSKPDDFRHDWDILMQVSTVVTASDPNIRTDVSGWHSSLDLTIPSRNTL